MKDGDQRQRSRVRPVRVLQLIPSVSAGGIESLVLALVENLSDNPTFQFDIAALNPTQQVHKKRFEELGARVHFIADAGVGTSAASKVLWRVQAVMKLRALVATGNYDVLHSHMGASHTPYTLVAWLHGIKIRIVHSHSAGRKDETRSASVIRRLRSIVGLECLVTHRVGCGDASTRWLWGDAAFESGRARTIYNGIPVRKFEHARGVRSLHPNSTRGVSLLHVGRFSEPKNQRFLLEVFAEVAKRLDSVHLNVVGFGPLGDDLKRHVATLGLSKEVVFHDQQADIAGLLSVADVFLLPSLSEGLPIVAVESQVAGVPIVVSDAVTREIDMGLAMFLPLELGAAEWADRTVAMLRARPFASAPSSEMTRRFDIDAISKVWAQLYASGRTYPSG